MKNLIIIAIFLSFLSGCATNVAVKDGMKIVQDIPFTVDTIDNRCGVNPEGKDSAQLMKDAMAKALAGSQLPQGENGYKINVVITEYAPGDAFKRWVMPGWGETKLTVQCVVKGKNDTIAGEMDVSKTISAGGAYTIGAFEYVFADVANAIVEEIKKKLV